MGSRFALSTWFELFSVKLLGFLQIKGLGTTQHALGACRRCWKLFPLWEPGTCVDQGMEAICWSRHWALHVICPSNNHRRHHRAAPLAISDLSQAFPKQIQARFPGCWSTSQLMFHGSRNQDPLGASRGTYGRVCTCVCAVQVPLQLHPFSIKFKLPRSQPSTKAV